MILTATKLTAAQLISFAMREYLPSMPMTAATFIRRVFTIHGRNETHPGEELVIFYESPCDYESPRDYESPHDYESPRDPAVNYACCVCRLNSRDLCRNEYALRFAFEPELARARRAD
jgi:hypothetical protein